MDALFITNLELNENEGIYKKICAEATAIGRAVGNCHLLMKCGSGTKVVDTYSGKTATKELDVLTFAKNCVEEPSLKLIYIRLMIPNPSLIALMKAAKKHGVKVLYEIPTYPYYGEQFRASRKKYRAVAKIAIDALFSPLIKKYADHIVIIKSNSKIWLHSKMVEINNGVNTEKIKSKTEYDTKDGTFRMVTVGTLFPYHGYDRVLAGLKNCNEKVYDHPVEFHVVGASQTINELKEQAQKLGLKRVIFHGMKTTDELNEMYEKFDVGLGCLALHRRNADIDTTLKIIEYYCRGVPVVTSGKSPYKNPAVTIQIPDGEDPVDINSLYNEWKSIDKDELRALSEQAKKEFSWDFIMKQLLMTCGIV